MFGLGSREINGVLTRGQCEIPRQVAGVGEPEFQLTDALLVKT